MTTRERSEAKKTTAPAISSESGMWCRAVREAISSAFDELEAEAPRREEEIARIDAEAKKTGEALDRYFRGFEEGAMPESACAPRAAER